MRHTRFTNRTSDGDNRVVVVAGKKIKLCNPLVAVVCIWAQINAGAWQNGIIAFKECSQVLGAVEWDATLAQKGFLLAGERSFIKNFYRSSRFEKVVVGRFANDAEPPNTDRFFLFHDCAL